jgi:phenylacetate-CoA ligase
MIYNSFIEKLALPLGDNLLGTNFMGHLRAIRKESKLSEAALNQLQHDRLLSILKFATVNSSFYKNQHIVPDANPIAWLKKFPILNKATVREQTDSILTRSKEGLIKNASSGSSGFQTIGYYTQDELDSYRATQILFWEWGGYHLGDKIIQTGMGLNRSKVKKYKDQLLRTKYTIAFSPDPQQIKELFSSIKPNTHSFLGYASSLYVYANIAKELGLDGPKFKTSVCWGDKLFPHYRKLIKEQFGCDVYETYGAAEGFLMAGQKDLEYMYLVTPNVYMEILDDYGNEVADGEMGHVVVTSLRARAMPLIRYKIGDLAVKLPKEKYPEKRDLLLPLLQRVVGRDTDIVRTPSGKRLIVHTFTGVLEYFEEIAQFRIIQNELSEIELEYIRRESFTNESISNLDKQLKLVIADPTLKIIYREVQEIPNSPSGKPQLILSALK